MDELHNLLEVYAHLRDLPHLKNLKALVEKKLAALDAQLEPKEPAAPVPKAVPAASYDSGDEEIERRV